LRAAAAAEFGLFFNTFNVRRPRASEQFADVRVFPSGGFAATNQRGIGMLGWAITFLIVALVAAVLGFGGIAGVAIEAAKIVFFVAILLFAISAIVGLVRGRAPTVP
jgi:uncharacterized membrane protein YtjA (UPF0391 family)